MSATAVDTAAGLSLLGINHRRTPVELRERLAVGSDQLGLELARLTDRFGPCELVLVSTCNRVEVYVLDPTGETSADEVLGALAASRGVRLDSLASYRHAGPAAVRHLFRVCAGLDSMIVGEDQILGQVKDAYLAACNAGLTAKLTNSLFQEALRVGKAVRSETRINEGQVSVGSVATAFAQRIFSDLAGKTALVLGAGDTAELVVRNLFDAGLGQLLVANRTPERGSALVQRYGGEWIPLDTVGRQAHRADIIIGSTASERPVLTTSMVREALDRRGSHPLFVLDVAVPRDVEPGVAELGDVFAYDIDDLQEVVVENIGKREAEITQAEALVASMTAAFERRLGVLDVEPLIIELRQRAEQMRQSELQRLFRQTELLPEQQALVERATRRIVNQLLHTPTSGIRETAGEGDRSRVMEIIRRLFGIG